MKGRGGKRKGERKIEGEERVERKTAILTKF